MLDNVVMPYIVARGENRLPPSPPRGALHLLAGKPNPEGAGDAAVYLLRGDATAGPITRIVPAEGVRFPPSLLPLARPVRIKVLHFNDLHGRVVAFTGQGCVPILSRMVTRLRAARDESAHNPRVAVLVASAGDDCGGVIFDELLGHDPASYQLHAGYRLSSRAGVDVGVLGNHDFDRGTALLAHAGPPGCRIPHPGSQRDRQSGAG